MDPRRSIVFLAAAALIAGAGCNRNNSGTDSATAGSRGSASAPEGRRGANLPRARIDGGSDLSPDTSGSASTTSGSSGISGTTSGTSGSSSGSTDQSGGSGR